MQDKERDLVDYCIDNFQFTKVEQVMLALGWKWNGFIPTEFELRQEVRKQFKWLLEHTDTRVLSTGGFRYEAFREDGSVIGLHLSFVLANSEADVLDLENLNLDEALS